MTHIEITEELAKLLITDQEIELAHDLLNDMLEDGRTHSINTYEYLDQLPVFIGY